MENRRENYRHKFPRTENHPVEVYLPGPSKTFSGTMTDLASWGVCVYLEDVTNSIRKGDRCRIRFSLPGFAKRFDLPGSVSHVRAWEGIQNVGIEFLKTHSPADEERDQLIWKFLVSEQQKNR